jgi:hypothetical protein
MGAHKHGFFSFNVKIERIKMISGDEYCAEVTTLRRHDHTGAARDLEVPNLPEEYGATAAQAEWFAADAMRRWLSARPFVACRDSAQEIR